MTGMQTRFRLTPEIVGSIDAVCTADENRYTFVYGAVLKELARRGIMIRPSRDTGYTCIICERVFYAARATRRYCSNACRCRAYQNRRKQAA